MAKKRRVYTGWHTRENDRVRKMKFPACTEVFAECKGRETPCPTCPYARDWKPKKKEEKNELNTKNLE